MRVPSLAMPAMSLLSSLEDSPLFINAIEALKRRAIMMLLGLSGPEFGGPVWFARAPSPGFSLRYPGKTEHHVPANC